MDIQLVLHEIFYPTTDIYASLDELKGIHVSAWREGNGTDFTDTFLKCLDACINRSRDRCDIKRFTDFIITYIAVMEAYEQRIGLFTSETAEFKRRISESYLSKLEKQNKKYMTSAVKQLFANLEKCTPANFDEYGLRMRQLHFFAFREDLTEYFTECFVRRLAPLFTETKQSAGKKTFVVLYIRMLRAEQSQANCVRTIFISFVSTVFDVIASAFQSDSSLVQQNCRNFVKLAKRMTDFGMELERKLMAQNVSGLYKVSDGPNTYIKSTPLQISQCIIQHKTPLMRTTRY